MIIAATIIFVITIVLGAVFTWLTCRIAPRFGLVDRPDRRRKMHKAAIPLGGGVAVYLATVVVLGTLAVALGNYRHAAWSNLPISIALMAAGGVIVIVGLIDDRFGLRGGQKLMGQIFASSILLAGGLVIQKVCMFGWTIELGILAIPFTMFWFIGAINAVNLLDGIDGLASTVGTILVLAISMMAWFIGRSFLATFALTFAGALIGFLRFNAPPAKIFLGDAGSMLIGLWIGALAIMGSLKGPGTVLLVAPLAIFAIPIFDSTAAVIRRKLSGRSIYTTDRGHIHHRLTERLGSTRRVLVIISGACALTAFGALMAIYQKNDMMALIACLTVVGIFIGTGMFGSVEFALVGRHLRRIGEGVFRSQGKEGQRTSNTTFHLQGTRDWKPLWAELLEQFEPFDLSGVRLDVNCPFLHEEFLASWSDQTRRDGRMQCWTLELPLTLHGEVVGSLEVFGESAGCTVREQLDKLLELFEIFQDQLRFLLEPDQAQLAPIAKAPTSVDARFSERNWESRARALSRPNSGAPEK